MSRWYKVLSLGKAPQTQFIASLITKFPIITRILTKLESQSVELLIYGSTAVDIALKKNKKIKDIDLLVNVANEFILPDLSPLAIPLRDFQSGNIFGWQINQCLADIDASLTIYTKEQPTPLFDDFAHSLAIQFSIKDRRIIKTNVLSKSKAVTRVCLRKKILWHNQPERIWGLHFRSALRLSRKFEFSTNKYLTQVCRSLLNDLTRWKLKANAYRLANDFFRFHLLKTITKHFDRCNKSEIIDFIISHAKITQHTLKMSDNSTMPSFSEVWDKVYKQVAIELELEFNESSLPETITTATQLPGKKITVGLKKQLKNILDLVQAIDGKPSDVHTELKTVCLAELSKTIEKLLELNLSPITYTIARLLCLFEDETLYKQIESFFQSRIESVSKTKLNSLARQISILNQNNKFSDLLLLSFKQSFAYDSVLVETSRLASSCTISAQSDLFYSTLEQAILFCNRNTDPVPLFKTLKLIKKEDIIILFQTKPSLLVEIEKALENLCPANRTLYNNELKKVDKLIHDCKVNLIESSKPENFFLILQNMPFEKLDLKIVFTQLQFFFNEHQDYISDNKARVAQTLKPLFLSSTQISNLLTFQFYKLQFLPTFKEKIFNYLIEETHRFSDQFLTHLLAFYRPESLDNTKFTSLILEKASRKNSLFRQLFLNQSIRRSFELFCNEEFSKENSTVKELIHYTYRHLSEKLKQKVQEIILNYPKASIDFEDITTDAFCNAERSQQEKTILELARLNKNLFIKLSNLEICLSFSSTCKEKIDNYLIDIYLRSSSEEPRFLLDTTPKKIAEKYLKVKPFRMEYKFYIDKITARLTDEEKLWFLTSIFNKRLQFQQNKPTFIQEINKTSSISLIIKALENHLYSIQTIHILIEKINHTTLEELNTELTNLISCLPRLEKPSEKRRIIDCLMSRYEELDIEVKLQIIQSIFENSSLLDILSEEEKFLFCKPTPKVVKNPIEGKIPLLKRILSLIAKQYPQFFPEELKCYIAFILTLKPEIWVPMSAFSDYMKNLADGLFSRCYLLYEDFPELRKLYLETNGFYIDIYSLSIKEISRENFTKLLSHKDFEDKPYTKFKHHLAHLIIELNRSDLLQVLYESGRKFKKKFTAFGKELTVLHISCRQQTDEALKCTQIILENDSKTPDKSMVFIGISKCYTPLHVAVNNGQLEQVKLLVNSEAFKADTFFKFRQKYPEMAIDYWQKLEQHKIIFPADTELPFITCLRYLREKEVLPKVQEWKAKKRYTQIDKDGEPIRVTTIMDVMTCLVDFNHIPSLKAFYEEPLKLPYIDDVLIALAAGVKPCYFNGEPDFEAFKEFVIELKEKGVLPSPELLYDLLSCESIYLSDSEIDKVCLFILNTFPETISDEVIFKPILIGKIEKYFWFKEQCKSKDILLNPRARKGEKGNLLHYLAANKKLDAVALAAGCSSAKTFLDKIVEKCEFKEADFFLEDNNGISALEIAIDTNNTHVKNYYKTHFGQRASTYYLDKHPALLVKIVTDLWM